MSTTRKITLIFDTEDAVEVENKTRSIIKALADSDALPEGVSACDIPVDPKWVDHALDVDDVDCVEISWTAWEGDEIAFDSSSVISGCQAVAMFLAIGQTR